MPYNAYPFIPRGVIAVYTGSLANIPVGWALCDGTNGTPNLLDKFVKGVAAGENPGATGGAASHSHTNAAHAHTNPGHAHTIPKPAAGGGSSDSLGELAKDAHTHGVSTDTSSSGSATVTIDSTGNLPSFFEVAYIMKV